MEVNISWYENFKLKKIVFVLIILIDFEHNIYYVAIVLLLSQNNLVTLQTNYMILKIK